MELWRNEAAQGLNFGAGAYTVMLPLLKTLSEVSGAGRQGSKQADGGMLLAGCWQAVESRRPALCSLPFLSAAAEFQPALFALPLPFASACLQADALTALRNYSRSPSAAAAAAASGSVGNLPGAARAAAGRAQSQRQASSGGSSRLAAAAAAAAAANAAAAAIEVAAASQPPSLRRRQRKPQHAAGGAGAGGAQSDTSSDGSVPAQRQSAGSLMWYMLEQVGACCCTGLPSYRLPCRCLYSGFLPPDPTTYGGVLSLLSLTPSTDSCCLPPTLPLLPAGARR
jgi:hypothetical protein